MSCLESHDLCISGLLTLAGSKWRTYHAMAEETVSEAVKAFGLEDQTTNRCVTESVCLIGSDTWTRNMFISLIQKVCTLTGHTMPLHTGPAHTLHGPRPMLPVVSACVACSPGVGMQALSPSNSFGCTIASLSSCVADLKFFFPHFLTDLLQQQLHHLN